MTVGTRIGNIEKPPSASRAELCDAALVRAFIAGGRATFTLESRRTLQHFTYRVSVKEDGKTGGRILFVNLLGAGGQFTYLGILNGAELRLTKNSCAGPVAPSVRAFRFMLAHAFKDEVLPDALGFYHEGMCGRCGRPLTDPESIRTGMGPVCSTRE